MAPELSPRDPGVRYVSYLSHLRMRLTSKSLASAHSVKLEMAVGSETKEANGHETSIQKLSEADSLPHRP